jgi:hypothetical protein
VPRTRGVVSTQAGQGGEPSDTDRQRSLSLKPNGSNNGMDAPTLERHRRATVEVSSNHLTG